MVASWILGRDLSSTDGTNTSAPAASPSSSPSSSGSKSSSNTGSIVGGVVGGVVGVVLITGLAWFIIRRRRRIAASQSEHHSKLEAEKAELDTRHGGPGHELSGNIKDHWNANGQSRELSGKPVMEMEGSPA